MSDEAIRAALGPTLMTNPLIDSPARRDRVESSLVRAYKVLELADDADKPRQSYAYDLGVWLAATDHLVQRVDELGGMSGALWDLLRDFLHESSPCSVCGASSVGEPPAAGDASATPAAGEGAAS